MRNAYLSAAIAVLASFSCAGYDNDGPNMRPGASRGSSTIAFSSSGSISGFAPYEPSDVLIVVTNFADRGVERWTGEEIKIPFTIDRYFGNRDKMIKSGALPKAVLIEMINYDVDSSAPAEIPEYDEVWVNGKKLKQHLTGENGAWTKQSLVVDTKYLKFPASVGHPAQNEVVIKVATKGGQWVTKVDWISLHIPAAPPVVLSHGINSDAAYLSKLKEKIDDLGIPTVVFDQGNHGNESVYNISKLTEIVKRWKALWRVDHVNIVGHSMGGLRARRYVKDNNDVFKVLQIASPNGGAPVADYLITAIQNELDEIERSGRSEQLKQIWRSTVQRKWENFFTKFGINIDPWNDAAIKDLQTTSMSAFNEQHRLKGNVDYKVVAGEVTWLSGPVQNAMNIAFSAINPRFSYDAEPTDMIVPVWSAHTMVPAADGSPLRGRSGIAWHSGLIDGGAGKVVEILKPYLVERKMKAPSANSSSGAGGSSKAASVRSALSSSGPSSSEPSYFMKSGFVESSGVVDVKFYVVNGGKTGVSLSFGGGNASVSNFVLKDPFGTAYSGVGDGVSITNMDDLIVATIASPATGEWSASFRVRNGPAAWSLTVCETEASVDFAPSLVASTVRVGEPLVVRVSPKVGGASATCTCTATACCPDGTYVTVPFAAAGAGVYTASVPTAKSGRYQILVRADDEDRAGLERSATLTGFAASSSSTLTGTASLSVTDADSDGLYDSLTVRLGVNLSSGGKYRVAATLSDADGQVVANGWSGVFAGSGSMTIPVAFDGATIYSHGATTKYVISEAKLYEISDAYEAEVDVRANLVSTSAYSYDQFAHPMVWFGTGSDGAMDADGNGVYDSLNVLLPLLSERTISGDYSWSAALMDSTGTTLGTASGTVDFPYGGGSTSVLMSFPASVVATSHVNGPYYVRNFILWRSGGSGPDTFELEDEYKTAPYAVKDFGGALATVDLGFCVPKGWSGSLILSSKASGTTFQKTHNQGDPIYLNYAFANMAGSAAIKNKFSNKFTLSNGGSLVDTWNSLGAGKYGWLGTGVAPEFLQNLKPGTYTLTCELDVNEQLPETDEYNNLLEVTFTVKATSRPNLKVTAASFSRSTIAKSESMTVHWRIENKGKQPAKKTKTLLRIYDTKTNKLKKTISVDCPPLAVGGGAEFAKSISGKTFGTGKFEIDIIADGKGALKETDKSDNMKWGTVTVTKDRASKSSSKVDWRFHKRKSSEADSFFLSNSSSMKKKTTKFKKGQKIYMRCGWWNATKKAVSGKMRVNVYLNGVSGVYFERTSWGKNSWWWNSSTAPSFLQKLPAGKYTLTAVLDSENSWKEKNEKDNVRTISFTVEGTPKVYANSSYTCAVGESVSWPITTEGKLTVGKLPKGLKYSGGAITGKATKKGTYSVKFVSKNLKGSVTKKIKIVVTAKKSSATVASFAKSANVVSKPGSAGVPAWAAGEYEGFSDETFADGCYASFAVSASGELNGDFSRSGEAWVLAESGKVGCDKTGNVVDVPVVLTCGDYDALGVIEIRRGCEGQPDGAVTFEFFCEDAEGEAFEASGERKP